MVRHVDRDRVERAKLVGALRRRADLEARGLDATEAQARVDELAASLPEVSVGEVWKMAFDPPATP